MRLFLFRIAYKRKGKEREKEGEEGEGQAGGEGVEKIEEAYSYLIYVNIIYTGAQMASFTRKRHVNSRGSTPLANVVRSSAAKDKLHQKQRNPSYFPRIPALARPVGPLQPSRQQKFSR